MRVSRQQYKPVGADTPVTFSALFNGASVSATVTIPKTVDTVAITRAELTMKTSQLRVEATSNTPGAVLTLYHAATGQPIGTMTDNRCAGDKPSTQEQPQRPGDGDSQPEVDQTIATSAGLALG